MRNNNDIHDEFLKKLIRQIPDDQPSDDFVAKVMKVIPATSLANKVEKSTSLKWWQWGLIAAAIVALGCFIHFFDLLQYFIPKGLFDDFNAFLYIDKLYGIVKVFFNIFDSFTIGYIPTIIIIAIGILYLVDRLIFNKLYFHIRFFIFM